MPIDRFADGIWAKEVGSAGVLAGDGIVGGIEQAKSLSSSWQMQISMREGQSQYELTSCDSRAAMSLASFQTW